MERRDDPAAHAEREQARLLGVLQVGDVAAHGGLGALDHLAEQVLLEPEARAGRHHLLGGLAGSGDDVRLPVLEQDDRQAAERHEPAQLARERAEGILQVERRAERAGTAVRRVEQVGAAPQLVAQGGGPGRLLLGRAALSGEARHQRPDDQRRDQPRPSLEGDEVAAVADVRDRGAALLEPGRDRNRRHGHADSARQPQHDRSLDDRDQQQLLRRRPGLVREEEHEAGDDRRVERQRDEAEPGPADPVRGDGREEDDSPGRERGGERPRGGPRAGGVRRREAHLEHRERHAAEPDDGEPPLDGPRRRAHERARTCSRAQRACSASSSSSPAAHSSSSGSCSGPPTLPRATSAFRRSQRGSFRGT
jgi:hypothetical protein